MYTASHVLYSQSETCPGKESVGPREKVSLMSQGILVTIPGLQVWVHNYRTREHLDLAELG